MKELDIQTRYEAAIKVLATMLSNENCTCVDDNRVAGTCLSCQAMKDEDIQDVDITLCGCDDMGKKSKNLPTF